MEKIIALGGNPNVGKSTVFNALTGLRQHTGNWPGKTVTNARGNASHNGRKYILVDLPGCYSLDSEIAEEECARDFLCSDEADAAIIVCDASCLERNLILVLQTLAITPNVVVCINLMDEAQKKQININIPLLSEKLGVHVVGTSARNKKGLSELMNAVEQTIQNPRRVVGATISRPRRTIASHPNFTHKYQTLFQQSQNKISNNIDEIIHTAETICLDVVTYNNQSYLEKDAKIDKILMGKHTAFPIMLLSLLGIFWLTITGANYPSQIISAFLFWVENQLLAFAIWLHVPSIIYNMLILGVYRVLAWVVSVMLPPMAIFFPLFTLLEDVGFLPRVACNLDKCFKNCCACGKQALTMCMVVFRMPLFFLFAYC